MSYSPPETSISEQLEAALEPGLDNAAKVGAERYKDAIKAGPRSGKQHPGLPRRSSRAGGTEAIQEQSGEHRDSVQAVDLGKTKKGFGAVDVEGVSNDGLEFLEKTRKSLGNVAEDEATHKEMLEGFKS